MWAGRVLTADGRGIPGARVYMTDNQGNIVVRQTNPAGYYRFVDVGAGANYILTVAHKSYTFQPAKSFFVSDDNLDVNFVAEEQFERCRTAGQTKAINEGASASGSKKEAHIELCASFFFLS